MGAMSDAVTTVHVCCVCVCVCVSMSHEESYEKNTPHLNRGSWEEWQDWRGSESGRSKFFIFLVWIPILFDF